jgi:acyl-CoA thioester hydrolase
MNNPYYGVLVDSIVNQYLIDECGYRTNKHPTAAIIANTYCDYFGSVSYPDMVECGLRVVKLGKTSVMYEVGIFRKGDEMVKAIGGSSHIWCEQTGGELGRPLKEGMPKEMRDGYLKLMGKEEGGAGEGAKGSKL